MLIKKLKTMSDTTLVWDKDNDKPLFTFVDGAYETNDKHILAYWSKTYEGGVIEAEVVEVIKVSDSSLDRDSIRQEIADRFGIEMDRRCGLKTLEKKLADLEGDA